MGKQWGRRQPQWEWARSDASALPIAWPTTQTLHTAQLKSWWGKGLPVPVFEFTSEKADGGDFKKEALAETAMAFAGLCSLQCRVWKAIKEIELL